MYSIRYNVSPPSKVYDVNDLEESFFEILSSKLNEQENLKICLIRMSDGTLSVDYAGCPVGKIKLQGRKYHMQILKGLYKFNTIFGTPQELTEHIDEWVTYIHRHLK